MGELRAVNRNRAGIAHELRENCVIIALTASHPFISTLISICSASAASFWYAASAAAASATAASAWAFACAEPCAFAYVIWPLCSTLSIDLEQKDTKY